MICNKILSLVFLVSLVLVIAGCGSGEGGGLLGFLGNSSSGGSSSTIGSGSSGGSIAGSGTGSGSISLAQVHQPEPSSILLLASGLIGMGIRARSKLRRKSKK